MTTANSVDKMDALKLNVPLEKIDDKHYLLGTYEDSDRLTAVQIVADKTIPAMSGARRYEFIDETPLLDLVKHHFENWSNVPVTFWFNRETGGIIDCTALETAQSAGASAA